MRVFMQFLYTQKERTFMNMVTNCFIKGSWSGRQDLNLRPLHPQSRAYSPDVVDIPKEAGVSA